MITRKDKGFLLGPMEECIKAVGKMENKMGKVNIKALMVNLEKEFGLKGREHNGLMNLIIRIVSLITNIL